jgi:hypothetical protein
MADLVTIKKIKVGENLHDIDAAYLGGKSFEQIQGMIHGVIDTYVIPSKNSSKPGYDTIVNSNDATVSISKSDLNGLVSPDNASGTYKLGDVILVEAVSNDDTNKGEKAFDRWVSAVNGDTITLSILETQVATHHHTFGTTTGSALTSVVSMPTTTNAIPTVGSAVTVLTGVSGEVITSVEYSTSASDKGGHSLELQNGTSNDGIGHSHTVNSHSHSVNITPNTLVSSTVEAYTSLSTSSHTPHTHTSINVAAVAVDDKTPLTYATGAGSKETFIKTLKDEASTTGSAAPSTLQNVDGLSTSTQASTDTIGDIVKTKESGSHSHSVSVETNSNVITSVDIAPNVTTSVRLDYNAPSVQTSVVTAVTYTSTKVLTSAVANTSTSTFVNGWVVDESGVLTLVGDDAVTSVGIGTSVVTVASEITSTVASQSSGSANLTVTSATQTYVSGKVSSAGTAASAGAHQHGFSHTHAIPAHTHTVASHTHSYVKSVKDATNEAYVSLNTSSYTPHKHEETTVISTVSDAASFTYVTDGSKTSVVKDLIDKPQTYTTTDAAPGTDSKYIKLTGDIDFPGLTLGKRTLSTTTVTPAVAGTEKPLASITFASANFVTGVNGTGDIKTSENKGGK